MYLPGALTAAIAPPIYGPLASKYLTTGGPDANYDKVYGIMLKMESYTLVIKK